MSKECIKLKIPSYLRDACTFKVYFTYNGVLGKYKSRLTLIEGFGWNPQSVDLVSRLEERSSAPPSSRKSFSPISEH